MKSMYHGKRCTPDEQQRIRLLGEQVTVYAIQNDFYCIDGHHRLAAYNAECPNAEVPVEHFEGSLIEAFAEATRRNSRDKLPTSKWDKLEAAWRLVVSSDFSKREIAEVTTRAVSTVGNMREVKRRLEDRLEEYLNCEDSWEAQALKPDYKAVSELTWDRAKREDKGSEGRDFDEEMKERMAMDWAKKLGSCSVTN